MTPLKNTLCSCFVLFLFATFLPKPLLSQDAPDITVQQGPNGITVIHGAETLRLTACGPDVIHVVAGPGNPQSASPYQPWIVSRCLPHPMNTQRSANEVTVSTSQIKVSIALHGAHLTFEDAAGNVLLKEQIHWDPRSYVPDVANGEKVYQVSDLFSPDVSEGLYGLGQHQNGVFNSRGTVIALAQINTSVAVPLLVSTNGYGILWNTASKSWFDDRFPRDMKFTSEAADAVDYYFFYGPEIDAIIHHYRDLTGHAPLF